MNLQEELKALKERIAELEERAKEEQEFPQAGEDYWYMNALGIIFNDKWSGSISEEEMLEIGNVFKTKEQAEFAAEKLKVEAELRKFSKPFEYGGNNYTFNYYHEKENIVKFLASKMYQDPGALYFESTDQVEEAIESVGKERIKKYIFGVEAE